MAIKTYNISDTTETNLVEVKSVLEEIGNGYIDKMEYVDVESDDNNRLKIYLGDKLILQLNKGKKLNARMDFTAHIIDVVNNTSKEMYDGSYISYKAYCSKIVATRNGIVIGRSGHQPTIFISKTSNGNKGVVWHDAFGNALLDSSSSEYVNFNDAYNISDEKTQPTTTLVPIVCSGTDDYFPNVFAVPTCPYRGVESVLTLDGVKYYYNGYVALKDE